MKWLYLTFASVIARAAFGVVTKVISNKVKVSSITLAVLLTGSGAVIALLLSPLLGGISFDGLDNEWWVASLMVVSSAVGNVLYFKGLEKLDASNAQVLFSSILIWGTLFSVTFLGSHFEPLQLIGVLILLGAIVSIQYKKQTALLNTSSLLILGAAVCFAVFQITSAVLSKTISTGTYSFMAYAGGTLIVGLVYRKKVFADIRSVSNRSNSFLLTIMTGSLSVAYAVFAFLAYQIAPDRGVVVLLLTTQVIFGVIFAVIFLKERQNIPKKILAAILAVLGGLLIKS